MKALLKILSYILVITVSGLSACVDTGLPNHEQSSEVQITYSHNLNAQFKVKFLKSIPESIHWDFGDGYQGSGNTISHRYLSPGSYNGQLSYDENGKTVRRELTIDIKGNNQNIIIKPNVNVIIDSDHNDPNQPYKDNNQTPQVISSPLTLSGILIKRNACQAGRLCSSGDELDWYSINLEHGDNLDIEVIKGSIDVLLQSSSKQIISDVKNLSNNLHIPSVQTHEGQFQLYIRLNQQFEKSQYIIHVQAQNIEASDNYQPGKLIVQWEDIRNPELVDISDPRLIHLSNESHATSLPDARDLLAQDTNIKSVSLNYYRKAFSSEDWQWPLVQQGIQTLWEPLIIRGESPGENTTVAILDTGLFFQHENLQGLKTHSGYDFVSDPINSGDNDGWDSDPTDPGDKSLSYHGSHVTGIVAAQPIDQSNSITGLAWGAQIMPLRVLGVNGGTSYDLIQALRYAAGLSNDSLQQPSKPADIINLSLGGSEFSVAEQATINEVIQTGAIIVAATGNQGQNQVNYPAGYKDVIAVGATDINGNIASYSNYGPHIDIVAPGGQCTNSQCATGIKSLSAIGRIQNQFDNRQSAWKHLSGTSMATAHVTGLLAIARSQLPSLDSNALNYLIKNQIITSDLLSTGFDTKSGWGRINSTMLLDLINTSDLDQPSLWTNQSSIFIDPNERIILPIITRGDIANKTVSSKYNQIKLNVTLNSTELIIDTSPEFNENQTIEVYLDDTLVSTINLHPKKTYKLPEFSQHLYLGFENSGINSSGLRTVIDQDTWQANIPPLSIGQKIQASSDIDYDGVYCELGEFCAYSEYDNPDSKELILNGSILGR